MVGRLALFLWWVGGGGCTYGTFQGEDCMIVALVLRTVRLSTRGVNGESTSSLFAK